MTGGALRLPPVQSIRTSFKVSKADVTASLIKQGELRNRSSPATLHGWVHRKPRKLNKALTFIDIRDTKGEVIQILDKSSPSLLKNVKPDSTVSVKVVQNGEDLECQDVTVLGEANLIPGQLLAEETRQWPAKYRYIQLRMPQFQKTLRARAAILRTCRSVLEGESFTEVETPILFKSTPEGAREFLVPTRRKGYAYALPQSPQQYKQLLIASGIDRYYQIAKCFRDEDLRADRQPEFTQLDLEMAFAQPRDVQAIVEKIVRASWKSVGRELSSLGPTDEPGFARLSYAECIRKYGIDKPDLRRPFEITPLPQLTPRGHSAFPVFEFISVPQESRNRLAASTDAIPRVSLVTFESEQQLKDELSKLATFSDEDWPETYRILSDAMRANNTNTLAFGDRQEISYENPTPLGKLRQSLVSADGPEQLGKSIAIWVEKFPSFEPTETDAEGSIYPNYNYNQLRATHHPFTMVDLEDYKYLEKEPLKCHGMHFDLVIDGVEVGGGSQRIHSSDLQRYILQNVLKVKDPDYLFGHLLGALETGCPPHAGLAIGLDRMIAMLLGFSSIRNVIAFPKTNTGTDPVVDSPSKLTAEQLAEYRLKLV